MATGAYDSNGIWQYGEGDNIALFSDLLNKSAASVSSAFTADRARISTLEAGSLAGLIPVVPQSVVVATGSASVTDVGMVNFTGASAISLNGVFTSSYKNYRVIFRATPLSSNVNISMRGRTAGTDYSGAQYSYAGYQSTSASLANVYTTAATSATAVIGFGTVSSVFVMDITNPQIAIATNFTYTSNGHNGTGNQALSASGLVNVTNQFDGISFYTSASTIIGEIQVFGYND